MSRSEKNRDFDGESLDEALNKAAKELEVNEAELDYEILEQGRRGLWGIGHKSVRIRVMPPIQPVGTDHRELTTDAITRGRSNARRGRGRGRGGQGGGQGGQRGQGGGGQGRKGPSDSDRSARGGENRGNRSTQGDPGGNQANQQRGQRQGGQRQGSQREGGEQADGQQAEGQTGRRRRRRSRGRGGAGSGERRPRGDGQRAKRVDRPDVSAEEAAKVEAGLQKIVDLMGLEVTAGLVEVSSTVALELKGPDESLLMGKESELLSSLEFILNRMSRRSWPEATRIHLGSNGHRTRRDDDVVELVKEVAQQVMQTGESKRLHPMNSYERRLTHLTVRSYDELGSRSEGDGPTKKVRIYKKRGAGADEEEISEEVTDESDAQNEPEISEEQEKSDL